MSDMTPEEMERRLYNARHGLADGATGGNLAERDRDGNLLHAGGANFDDLPKPVGKVTNRYDVAPSQSAVPRRKGHAKRKRTAWEELRARMRRRESLRVDSAEEALRLWASYRVSSRSNEGSVLHPDAEAVYDRKLGEPVGVQVLRFVEETRWFEYVERALRSRHGLEPAGAVAWASEPWPRVTLATFTDELQGRLPYVFLGPWVPLCEAEVDELEAEDRRDEAERTEAEKAADGGRLMTGMRRVE